MDSVYAEATGSPHFYPLKRPSQGHGDSEHREESKDFAIGRRSSRRTAPLSEIPRFFVAALPRMTDGEPALIVLPSSLCSYHGSCLLLRRRLESKALGLDTGLRRYDGVECRAALLTEMTNNVVTARGLDDDHPRSNPLQRRIKSCWGRRGRNRLDVYPFGTRPSE